MGTERKIGEEDQKHHFRAKLYYCSSVVVRHLNRVQGSCQLLSMQSNVLA